MTWEFTLTCPGCKYTGYPRICSPRANRTMSNPRCRIECTECGHKLGTALLERL